MQTEWVGKTLASRDGLALQQFSTGVADGPVVVLVNAMGMPSEFMRPLASDLALRGYRVLSWESRGVPNLEAGFRPDRCGVGNQADDLEDLLDANDVARATVLGWCSGAQVALRFASQRPNRVSRLVLVNGAYSLWRSCAFLPFQDGMNGVTPLCATSPESAALISAVIIGQVMGTGGSDELSQQVAPLVSAVPPEVVHLTAGVFADGERLYRYSNMEQEFLKEPDHAWTEGVRAPTLVIAGDANVMVNPASSQEIARRIAGSRLHVVSGGNHYMHYLRADCRAEIIAFIEEGRHHANDVLGADAAL